MCHWRPLRLDSIGSQTLPFAMSLKMKLRDKYGVSDSGNETIPGYRVI